MSIPNQKIQSIKTPTIQFTFLGTGTSQGVPVIGCDCEVCQSDDTKDKRLRTAGLVTVNGKNIAIDAGPDFRQQMLVNGIVDLEGILLTHQHNDHIIGLDDVRPFNFKYWKNMPVYGTRQVLEDVRHRFAYIFDAENKYPGAPMVDLFEIDKNTPVSIAGIQAIPIEVLHGKLPVMAWRFGDLTYITDAKTIAASELEKVAGTRVLILNALHHNQHHSHLNLNQAIDMAQRIGAEQSWFVHMSHRMGLHEQVNAELPPGIQLAYDGLRISL